jgi:hypothetical protein
MDAAKWIGLAIAAVAAAAGFGSYLASTGRNDLSVLELRPRVAVKEEITVTPCPPRRGSDIKLQLVNAGKLPAKRTRSHVQATVGNTDWPPSLTFARPLFDDASVRTLEPGIPSEVHVKLTDDVPSGYNLFLYGLVEYDDGFGATITKPFCVRYQPLGGQPCGYNFVFCPDFNT